MDICAATSTGDNKRVVNTKNRDWHKRLRLRKTAVQPPTMQSEDKHGPKKIAEEWERNRPWPSSKKSPRKTKQSQHRARNSGNILRFKCSQCKDNVEFVPKDLVRHFEETHRGSSPVFPCHMCAFSTHEFSYLQVHLLSHKDTFSSCHICNDNVQRTFSEFSTHLTAHHCQNGKYSCETCEKFSTSDAGVFLEHMYLHNLGLESGSEIDLSVHTKKGFQKQFGCKTTTHTFHCQYCGYETPQKRLITKHMNTVHVGQNGNQNMKEVHPITIKPNDANPKMKHRLTRNRVREMCWLSEGCLSLPGREFLDKYCSLSDPETTLEETQQFLMRSTAGETGGQKWTKALKTVLSNVPQDVNLHPKSENGIMSNSGFPNSSKDLTVLTVKNQITVPQNGTAYAKRFKTTTPSEKEEPIPPESAAVDAHCVFDPNRCQPNLNDQIHGAHNQMTLNDDASISAQNEPAGCAQIQENRENQELKIDGDIEEHKRKCEEAKNVNPNEDGTDASKELKLTKESDDQTSISKALPKNKSRKRGFRRGWRRKTRSKTRIKRSSGLKLVLKKNPVKEKQWTSQSPVSPSGGGLPDDHHLLPNPHTTLEETQQFVQIAPSTENDQKNWTKAPETDQHSISKAITSTSQSKSEEELDPKSREHLSTCSDLSAHTVENKISVPPDCTTKPTGFQNMDGQKPLALKAMPSTNQEIHDETEQSLQCVETEVDNGSSAGKTSQSHSEEPSVTTERCPETVLLQNSDSAMECHVSDNEETLVTDGETPRRNYAKSSLVPQPVITPQGKTPSEDSSLAVSEQSVQGKRKRELPTDPCPDLLSTTSRPSSQTIQEEPSAASARHCQPAPRDAERTLKLIAVSPSQLVKRPLGEQPVVVLNHPDADIPEVTKIMEVVHRYRGGEVQKVILSRKTLNALSAADGEIPGANGPTNATSPGPTRFKTSVQERFILKLKLRRMSRKKYEVVSAVSPSRDLSVQFRCWFCGRVFASQETWMVHRQRHLMEWKRPNCENS
ncbi:uncharacterized protein znf518a [Centroberyx gerrardi]